MAPVSDPLLDDLLGLLCFARVVEQRSFTAAAKTLELSKSAVSSRVSELERRLGERLLNRTTRKLTVTDAGLQVYAHCAQMLENARAATHTASAGHGLRVNAPVTFAQMYLITPLARFMSQHPDVQLELRLDDRVVDLVEERVDLAIRITKPRSSNLVMRRLASTSLHVCASPSYLQTHGTPRAPEDLLRHECLRYAVLSPEDEWRLYGERGRIPLRVSSRFQTFNGAVLREAAVAGLGLAMLPRFMIHEELRRGALVTVLDRHAPRPMGIYAVQIQRRAQPARLKALIELLANEFASPAWA
ncbi:MAG TPA: LysR family transcriptional regulator [Polyangiaceae bacterium]